MPILTTQTKKQPLKTKAEATRRVWHVVVGWQREFDDLRAVLSSHDQLRMHLADFLLRWGQQSLDC